MSSTKGKNRLTFLKILSINVIIFLCLTVMVWSGFSYLEHRVDKKIETARSDSNIIRATYPNYDHYDYDYAKRIFEDYSEPEKEYQSFTAYRRKGYDGKTVNIDFKTGFRKSINHSINGSVWFFGGSTMWGTGADDESTIPSYFAKITGQDVLNLGESGYNSFQELIQLQKMLAKGHRPKSVVFYDGANDGYYFCQKDDIEKPKHAFTSRYKEQKKELDEAKRKLNKTPIINFDILFKELSDFAMTPYRYFRKRDEISGIKPKHSNSITFEETKRTKKYLHCDEGPLAKRAANITVFSWLSAAQLLKAHGIKAHFVLQPTAQFQPQNYELDHIINYKKRAIANEQASYESYYPQLRSQWEKECKSLNVCKNFRDLSSLFFDTKKPIFIDNIHIGPNGNRMVAEALAHSIDTD